MEKEGEAEEGRRRRSQDVDCDDLTMSGSSRGGGDQGYPQAQKCVREDMMSVRLPLSLPDVTTLQQVMRECFRPVACLHIRWEDSQDSCC